MSEKYGKGCEPPKSELEQAAEVLAKVAKRAMFDDDFCDEIRKDQIELLRASGMSIVALAKLQRRCDLTDTELQSYVIALEDPDDDPPELKLTNFCVATCKKQTFFLCGGCTNSFKANLPGG